MARPHCNFFSNASAASAGDWMDVCGQEATLVLFTICEVGHPSIEHVCTDHGRVLEDREAACEICDHLVGQDRDVVVIRALG